jgi:hypothetical protein
VERRATSYSVPDFDQFLGAFLSPASFGRTQDLP